MKYEMCSRKITSIPIAVLAAILKVLIHLNNGPLFLLQGDFCEVLPSDD